mgnify:CR=1 FL=1
MTDKTKQHEMNQWGACDTVRADGVKVKALTEDMIQENRSGLRTDCCPCKTCRFWDDHDSWWTWLVDQSVFISIF